MERFPAPEWFSTLVEKLNKGQAYHAAIVVEEQNKPETNFGIVNEHQALAELYFEASSAVTKLVEQNSLLTETLKARVIVALGEAKDPPWKATHRHYKGKLYRVTGYRQNTDHDELEEQVEYDDEEGNRYTLSRRRWDSLLGSGKPRYEFIP